jgi:hypothetical protein
MPLNKIDRYLIVLERIGRHVEPVEVPDRRQGENDSYRKRNDKDNELRLPAGTSAAQGRPDSRESQ